MNVGDIVVGFLQNDNSLIGGAMFMTLVASVMIYHINKKIDS